MKRYILTIIYLVIYIISFGQHNNATNFINIPPNPTSSKFKLNTENQINLSSGMINIPIDLFGVQVSSFAMNFQLTYSTSGISIMDSPIPFGYGWQLSINPRVTRQVLGRADEKFPFKGSYNPSQSNWGNKFNSINGGANSGDFGDYYEPLKGIVNTSYTTEYQLVNNDLFDPQKDIFTVQLPNKAINFILKWNGNLPVAITYGNHISITLKVSNRQIQGIKVIDEDGTLYKFGNLDNETDRSYFEEYGGIENSWLLREIVLVNGQKLGFNWVEKNISSFGPSISSTVSVKDYKLYKMDDSYDFNPTIDAVGGNINIAEYSSPTAKFLSKVVFPGGVVDIGFKAGAVPTVNGITLRDGRGYLIKDVKLTHGPLNGTNFSHFLLNGIEVGNEKYSFQYNSNYFSKDSPSIDLWGMYNGKSNQAHPPSVRILTHTNSYGNSLSANFPLFVNGANRDVDTTNMRAFMLEKIIFPTGGSTQIIYEPHRFSYTETYPGFSTAPVTPTMGGGLRVRAMRYFDENSMLQFEKTYRYGKNENGLAKIKLIPTMNTMVDEIFSLVYGWPIPGYTGTVPNFYRNIQIKSLSDYKAYDFGKSAFWYEQVTEYSGGGKTVRDFIFKDDDVSNMPVTHLFQKRFTNRVYTLFQGGPKMEKETVFKKVGNVYDTVFKKEYFYQLFDYENDSTVSNMAINRRFVNSSLNQSLQGIDVLYPYQDTEPKAQAIVGMFGFNIANYSIIPCFYQLTNSIVTEYSNSGQIRDIRKLTYSSQRNNYISKEEGTNSTGQTITVSYKYPFDFVTGIGQTMTQRNMIIFPLEREIKKGTSIRVEKNIFSNDLSVTNGLLLLREKQVFENGTIIDWNRVNRFDKFGNPVEVMGKLKPISVQLWGYGGRYPVITIGNSSYQEVLSALGGNGVSILNSINENVVSDELLASTARTLRDHSSLKKSLVGARTYKNLVGISSVTDEKGDMLRYIYDSQGRLEQIRDITGNVLQFFCYNYKGEQIDCKVFFSTSKSQQFTRNNCAVGQQGGTYTHSVAAGKYTSTISQADADRKAAEELAIEGQAAANSNAPCNNTITYTDLNLEYVGDWGGRVQRVRMVSTDPNVGTFDLYPSLGVTSETFSIPVGNYSSIQVFADGTGANYDGFVNIVSSSGTQCQNIGMGGASPNFTNIQFSQSGTKRIVVQEYCM